MPSTPLPDPNAETKSFKLMLMALAAAIFGILQAIVRKPFRR